MANLTSDSYLFDSSFGAQRHISAAVLGTLSALGLGATLAVAPAWAAEPSSRKRVIPIILRPANWDPHCSVMQGRPVLI